MITLLVGTTKGAFLVTSKDRTKWQVTGPHCNGWTINHMAADPETGTIWAGGGGDFFGAGVFCSRDSGETWDLSRLTIGQIDGWAESEPEFAAAMGVTGDPLPFGDEFSQIWSVAFAHGTLYAGTKPAQLLESTDGGVTFSKNASLSDYADRHEWQPGAAGLVLHTIVNHPEDKSKKWLGISAAGVFATEDGGASWERRNRLSNAEACEGHGEFPAPANGEIGYCVHNMMRADAPGDLLYQQNHHGVWKSSDGGRSWDDIGAGLPSTFGFPIRVHPRNKDMIWTLPLNGDSKGRFPPDAAAAVWKSSDGGATWAAKREGLPQEACYFTVLRQAMAGDAQDPIGLYFGTNSGSIFASLDEGESWTEIISHLPTILSVETLEQ